jgi:hypothetical protein
MEERSSVSKSSIRMGRTKRCTEGARRNIYAGWWFTSALNAKYVNTHLSLLAALPAESWQWERAKQGSKRERAEGALLCAAAALIIRGRGRRIGLQPPCVLLHCSAPQPSLLYQRAYFKGVAAARWWAWDESVLKSVCHLCACSYQLSHHVQLCICLLSCLS